MERPGPVVAPGWAVAAWALVVGGAVAAALALALPGLREPLTLLVAPLSVVAGALGLRRHRPRARGTWRLVVLMVGLLAVALALPSVAVLGPTAHVVAVAVFSCGQVVAGVAVVGLVRRSVRAGRGSRTSARRPDRAGSWWRSGRVEVLVIAVVLGLTAAQVVSVAVPAAGDVAAVVVPSVNVAILGILLRFAVSRRGLTPSAHLFMAAGLAVALYDTSRIASEHRVALPGEPVQAVGVLCMALFSASLLHPSVRTALTPEALAGLRRPSAALLGLLPLAAVPGALWWVGTTARAGGLPTGVFVVAGVLMSALCLVRGATALRGSEHQAEHDPLTDLLDRRGLARAFARRSGQRSLLLVDLDEFKQVNDAHGHDVGDALLLQVRDRLLVAAGPDAVVARLGGDEFVVLVEEARADAVVRRVLTQLRRPVDLDGLAVRSSASVGVARPGDGDTLAQLLTSADVALYAAKAAGRDTCADFRPELQAAVAERLRTGVEVRRLLSGEDGVGALEVHYQPLVELTGGRVVGAEALVRWRHPERGLVLPGAFLGAVQARGLDVRLDDAVLHLVAADLAGWRARGLRPVPVSVNLGRDSLVDPDLSARVVAALERSGLPRGLLHVEVTEHQALPDDDVVARNLEALAAAGVDVHLDDYGTGYTSVDYLQRFPVAVLKLDRAVTTTVTDGRRPVVAGIVAMATTLGLDVLAEGVETPEQRDALVALGIRYGQGWLFGRPAPADEHLARLPADDGRATSSGATAPPAAVPPRLPAPRATAPAQASHQGA